MVTYKGYTIKFTGGERVTKATAYDAVGRRTHLAAYGSDAAEALERIKHLLDRRYGMTKPIGETHE